MSGPRYTDQQRLAIFTRQVSVGLSAGAGCGKTFVLTQRFLAQLEPGDAAAELRNLVAITFTDRAAREMRDRIRSACQKRLDDCDDGDVAHWQRILRGLDAARISTIHSFCTGMLRSHAIEAGLDPRFVLLEPPLAETLREEAVNATIERLIIDEDPDVEAYVLRFGLEKTRQILSSLVAQRFRMEWAGLGALTPASLSERWLTAWHQEHLPRLWEQVSTSAAWNTLAKLVTAHEPEHAVMQERWGVLRGTVLNGPPAPSQFGEFLPALREATMVQGGGGKKAWNNDEALFETVKETLSTIRGVIDKILKKSALDVSDLHLSAELACQGLRLTHAAVIEYEARKRQSAALDFDDLLLRARDLLRDHPQVCQRFAHGIDLLMVDEFQDTDPVQTEIVRALCGAALTEGKLFLVGDIKQSIYRFRRADPEVFVKLRKEIPEAGQLSLTTNFRSQPEILRFVNFLFGRRLKDIYEPLQPFAPEQLTPPPTIQFLFATYDATPLVDADEADDDEPGVAQLRAREADWIARHLSALLNDPTPKIRHRDPSGKISLRRVEAGDIVLLFRALTNVGLYETALRRYGLDYYLVGGKTFYAQQEVFDLLNLCRCLDEPEDTVALIGVLRSPFFGFSDDTLQLGHPPDNDWWAALAGPAPTQLTESQAERWRFAGHTLATLRGRKDEVPIVTLLEEALTRTGYDAALLTEFLGSRKVANLRKLLDQAAAFDRGEAFTLKDFVQRLQTSVLEQTDEEFATTLPESGDVIRLMSVHQSKGLEFPVVVLADINRKKQGGGPGTYLHPEWGALVRIPDEFGEEHTHPGLEMLHAEETAAEQEETIRLFYVATTRAADLLILSAGTDADVTPKSPWMQLLAEQFDLLTGLPRHDALLGAFGGAASPADIPHVGVVRVAPEAVPVQSDRQPVGVAEIIATVAESAEEPLPMSASVIPRDGTARRWWSVSQLEQTVAELDPTWSSSPVKREGDRDGLVTAQDAEQLGILVHAVLERCDFTQPETWQEEIVPAARRAHVEVTEDLVTAAWTVLQSLRGSSLLTELTTAAAVYRELEFVHPWSPHDVIRGICDCVYRTSAGDWRLIDFKTGTVPAHATDSDLLAPYRVQLALYSAAFTNWCGQPLEQAALVFLQPRLRVVPFTLTPSEQTPLMERIHAAISHLRAIN